jgi:hypothetical protein
MELDHFFVHAGDELLDPESDLGCPYCGESFHVNDKYVRCPVCSRAHHEACWHENGSHCATHRCSGAMRLSHSPAPGEQPDAQLTPPTIVRNEQSSILDQQILNDIQIIDSYDRYGGDRVEMSGVSSTQPAEEIIQIKEEDLVARGFLRNVRVEGILQKLGTSHQNILLVTTLTLLILSILCIASILVIVIRQ